jgi:hypothetical protein
VTKWSHVNGGSQLGSDSLKSAPPRARLLRNLTPSRRGFHAEARRTALRVQYPALAHGSSPSTTSNSLLGPAEGSWPELRASAGRGERGRPGRTAPRLRVNHVARGGLHARGVHREQRAALRSWCPCGEHKSVSFENDYTEEPFSRSLTPLKGVRSSWIARARSPTQHTFGIQRRIDVDRIRSAHACGSCCCSAHGRSSA